MLAISRFKDCDIPFLRELEQVAAFWERRPGNISARIVCSIDEPDLALLISEWVDVGSYRRAFSGYEAKAFLTPILCKALNEPSAYLSPEEL